MIKTHEEPPGASGGIETQRRSKRQQVRDHQIEILLSKDWKRLPDGRWLLTTSRFKVPYTTQAAIDLAKLRGEIRAKGHTWAL